MVGECRGGETLDMLQAMNTGHDGSLTTVHANSVAETLERLEMMIALSRRINDLNYDPTDPDRTAHWFWILIDNLNLSDFSDRNMNVAAEAATYDTFKRVVVRTYGANGIGGLFPLLSAKQDQRRVEIWFQMQSWAMIFV